ncbi:MAG: beta-lactamase family protein [Chloroflexi bacterium]|jgi:putative pyoverdin transport system ATP-binding/permease protein|nr:beta-lactamase family protein [Chloroflexota bacterium]MBT4072177.1 beta-lactamase family protein [Chloroflexota bacterium]MBT4514491.1 beta-lactamase family protein [Chloroflexota bacterium]MBT6683007.1 beta-lactamase family protein [Chloroflexota bacterium]
MGFTPEQESIVERFIGENDIPGAAVAIVRGNEIIAEGGFGVADVSKEAPATEHTIWPICSITKSFTAVSAMQLVESGKLSLDEPVQTYLPGFRLQDEAASRRMTTRLFLRHNSGMGRTGHQDRTREEDVNPYPTRETLVNALDSAELQSAPGEAFSYCNEGFATVGHMIETISGVPLEEYFTRNIFEPVGMSDSSIDFMDWKNGADRTYAYSRGDAGAFDSGERHGDYIVVRLNDDYQTFLSTGGIVSSVHDIARYQIASMAYEDSPLGLTAGSLDHMQSVQFPFGDTGWGYGFGYWVFWSGSTRVVGHSGGLPGISTYSMMIPSEKTGVVVFTNRGDRRASFLAEEIMNTVRGPLWRDSTNEPLPYETRYPKPSASDLAEYEGNYEFRAGTAEVEAGEGGVVIKTPSRLDGPPVSIVTTQVGPDTFMSQDQGMSIPFVRGDSGRVVRFLNGGYSYERV